MQMQTVIQNQVTEVQRLKKLVNNFLLLSQLKADSITTTKTKLNIAELCIEIIQSFQSPANEKKEIFKLELYPTDADYIVLADKEHLLIVLSNLIGNAIKYKQAKSLINICITKNTNSISLIIKNKTAVIIEDVNNLKNKFKRIDFCLAMCAGYACALYKRLVLLMMSRKYKFHDQDGLYFISFATLH